MFRFIYIGFVLFVQYIIIANSCDCECDTPLETIFQVVQHFKVVHACNRHFTTKYGVSNAGVRHISYKGELNGNETASQLCKCVHDYLNQVDWLEGSKGTCCAKNNFATLRFKGEPDPLFNESIPDGPIELLKKTFDQFPHAEFEHHNCRPTATIDENGCPLFKVECDLRPDSPCKRRLCDGILVYLNQDHWLGKLSSTCVIEGKVLHMEIRSANSDVDAAKC